MTEWADDARTRQGLYRFTAAALRPPDRERLTLLTYAVDQFEERDLDRYAFARAWRAFAHSLSEVPEIADLESEYVRLFGVGMTGVPAPPIESFYRLGAVDSVGIFVSALQSEYRSMGVSAQGSAEAPDHVATEMEVMSFLCRAEAEAWRLGDSEGAFAVRDRESSFLSGHLVSWVPVFADRVRRADPSTFYHTLIDLLHAFVVGDRDYLQGTAIGRSA